MRLTERVHKTLSHSVYPGDYCIDLTLGNGLDAIHLSGLVGTKGKVFAFDIQDEALNSTRLLLSQKTKTTNLYLFKECHSNFTSNVPPELKGKIKAIVMNLGYLPGSSKSIITTPSSTLKALKSAYSWLSPRGFITIISYRGHKGGLEEFNFIQDWIVNDELEHEKVEPSNDEHSPVMFLLRKSQKG